MATFTTALTIEMVRDSGTTNGISTNPTAILANPEDSPYIIFVSCLHANVDTIQLQRKTCSSNRGDDNTVSADFLDISNSFATHTGSSVKMCPRLDYNHIGVSGYGISNTGPDISLTEMAGNFGGFNEAPEVGSTVYDREIGWRILYAGDVIALGNSSNTNFNYLIDYQKVFFGGGYNLSGYVP